MMKKRKKILWITVLALCVLTAAVGCFFLIRSYTATPAVKREDVTPTTSETTAENTGETVAQPTVQPTEVNSFGYKMADPGDLNIDFDQLQAINPDIYAWIYIPNTNIDYAVVRSTTDGDDFFYLDHNIYRQYQFAGSIYSEVQNHPDMHDPVTVLYGHNMRDGSMFATLYRFSDADFFQNNTTAFVVTKDKIFTYLIYASYSFDDRHILNSYHFDDDASFRKYLDSTLQPHSYQFNVRENVELSTKNRILTLSTCTESSGTRYLVQGVLVNEQEK